MNLVPAEAIPRFQVGRVTAQPLGMGDLQHHLPSLLSIATCCSDDAVTGTVSESDAWMEAAYMQHTFARTIWCFRVPH